MNDDEFGDTGTDDIDDIDTSRTRSPGCCDRSGCTRTAGTRAPPSS